MKQPMVWATTLAFSATTIFFFFLTWFPSYLNHSLHLDIKEISIATVIPRVIGAIGMVLGGVCSDVIYRITGNALLSRRLILGVCLAGAAVCVAVSGTVSTIGSAITLMSVSLFLLYLTGPIYWAVIQDVVHKDKVGSVGGAMHGQLIYPALSVRLSPVLSFNLAVNMTMRSIWLVLSLSFQACWSACL